MHTHQGWSTDGTCNGSGCGVNWGKHPQTSGGQPSSSLFGRNGIISTAKPFRVDAAFGADGSLSTTLSQEGRTLPFFNSSSAGNPVESQSGVPPHDTGELKAALTAPGLVLTVSLWTGDMSWMQAAPRTSADATTSTTSANPLLSCHRRPFSRRATARRMATAR